MYICSYPLIPTVSHPCVVVEGVGRREFVATTEAVEEPRRVEGAESIVIDDSLSVATDLRVDNSVVDIGETVPAVVWPCDWMSP